MLEGKAHRRIARVHIQLVEDGAHMGIDRVQTDGELLGDLGVSQSLGQQAHHFHLALGQPGGIGE